MLRVDVTALNLTELVMFAHCAWPPGTILMYDI